MSSKHRKPTKRNPTGVTLDAEVVRDLMKKKNWEQPDLAGAAEVTIRIAWKACNGESISIENADQIAIALNKRYQDLMVSPARPSSVNPIFRYASTTNPPGCVTADGQAIVALLRARGWAPEDLARESGIHVDVISRAVAGGVVERDSLERIAKALGARFLEILGTGPLMENVPTNRAPSDDRKGIWITINVSSTEAEALVQKGVVQKLLNEVTAVAASSGVVINLDVKIDSLHIYFEADGDDAERILAAFKDHKLAHLDVVNVTIQQPRRIGSWVSWVPWLLGGLGVLCAMFALIVPLGPLPSIAGAIVFIGGVFLVFLTRKGSLTAYIFPLLGLSSCIAAAIIWAFSAKGPNTEEKERPRPDGPPITKKDEDSDKSGSGETNEPTRKNDTDVIVRKSPERLKTGIEQPKNGKLNQPPGTLLKRESYGSAGFIFSGAVTVKGNHGGGEMTVNCWYDANTKRVTFVANNHKLPRAGFFLYQSTLSSCKLVAATFYPANEVGDLQEGESLREPATEGTGEDELTRFYASPATWPHGGEWRVIYECP